MMLYDREIKTILGARIMEVLENSPGRLGLRLDNGKCVWVFLSFEPGDSYAVVCDAVESACVGR